MKRVLAIILGGGAGTRLYPLTKMRAKPAVPLAGKYRLIDIPISNCINSGVNKIYVLTQFNSASLNRHLTQTYNLSAGFGQGFVEVLAAQQTPDSPSWFEGTADAVRKYQWLFQEWDVDHYLILSGDQLYRMDYSQFVDHHINSGADLSVGALPVDQAQAESFGLMRAERDGRIREFSEKPKGAALESMKVDTASLGLSEAEAARRPYLASMGIYVFNRHTLFDLLARNPTATDFGKEIIPWPWSVATTSRVISSTTTGKTLAPSVRFMRPTWRSPINPGRPFPSTTKNFRSTPGRVICLPASCWTPRSHSRSSARAPCSRPAAFITACSVCAPGSKARWC